jgi:hypothetical protein
MMLAAFFYSESRDKSNLLAVDNCHISRTLRPSSILVGRQVVLILACILSVSPSFGYVFTSRTETTGIFRF